MICTPLGAWGNDIVDSNNGIAFQVRTTAVSGVVSITWQVSGSTLAAGANDFEIQFYVGRGQQWLGQVSTDEPSHNGIPINIGGVPMPFCFRMVATRDARGPILGSGTSGNKPPCAADPAQRPDLVVTGVSLSDSSPAAGQDFTLQATVRNQGEADSGPTTLRYYRSADTTISTSDTPLTTEAVSALAPGGSSPESALVSIGAAGSYWVGACVDSVAQESPTSNNCSAGLQVRVSDPALAPDLVVTDSAASQSTPEPGQSFSLRARVRNHGGGSSDGTTLRYYRSGDANIATSDFEIASDAVPGLSPNGASLQEASVAIATVGTHWLGACVDAVAGEASTANNCSSGVRVVVNHRPTALADLYNAVAGRLLVIEKAAGLLANDSDRDGQSLSASLTSGPSHGTLTLNADGSFVYGPARDFRGFDSFTYRASDGLQASGIARVTIAVRDPSLWGVYLLLLD